MDRRRIEPTFVDGAPSLPLSQDYAVPAGELVAIRERHIGHERQLKSVALVYALATLGTLVSVVLGVSYGGLAVPGGDRSVLILAFVAGLGLFFATLAYGYRTLRPWITYVGTPVSCLGLFAFPVGTLVHGYILYLVLCKKGQRILQPDYAAIIRSTPDVRYKMRKGDKIATGVLFLLIAAVVALIFFGYLNG